MRTEVILVLIGAVYGYELYQNVLKDTGASQNTVCPLSEQLFEVRVPSVVSCAYLCGGAPLGCKGTSYDEQSGMCYGCRNTPGSTTVMFGTEIGVLFYAIVVSGCGTLTAPANGAVDLSDGTDYLSVSQFTCDAGYELTGATERTCQANSMWETPSPTCVIKDCDSLVSPSDGTVITSSGTVFQSVAEYTCDAGYDLNGVTTRTCTSTGTWDGSAPICKKKDCGPLVSPSGGAVDTSSGTVFQSVAGYTCDAGYDLNGVTTRTCTSAGTWDGAAPTCSRKDCGPLVSPSGGAVDTSSGTVFQSVAGYTCDAGYDLNGVTTRTCTSAGTWDGAAPTCSRKDCGPLVSPSDGAVDTSTGTVFQSVASYTCNVGYDLNGANTRTCRSAGTWDGATPTCSRKDCGTLTAPISGSVNLGEGTLFEATATFSCGDGFALTGSASRICMSTGFWGGASPTCVVACNEPPTVNNAILLAGGTSVGTIRRYTCMTDYTNHVQYSGMSVTCQANGSWSTSTFQCLAGLPQHFRQIGQQILKFGFFGRNNTVARSLCDKYGALVKIDTDEKQTAIETFLIGLIPVPSSAKDFFIQATRGADSVWRYDNGDAISEDNLFWAEGEPNEPGASCMVLIKDHDWRWADASCSYQGFFICEYFEKD